MFCLSAIKLIIEKYIAKRNKKTWIDRLGRVKYDGIIPSEKSCSEKNERVPSIISKIEPKRMSIKGKDFIMKIT